MPLRLTNQRQSLVFTDSAHAIPHMQALRKYISRRARDAAIIDIHLYMYSYTLCIGLYRRVIPEGAVIFLRPELSNRFHNSMALA